jgi:glucarate dehydratase
MTVCKHTHGELGLAAAAGHQVLLSLPAIVDGHQQTASIMAGDILTEPIPIASGPTWGVPHEPGLGVQVDEEKVGLYHDHYLQRGQCLPYTLDRLAPEDPEWGS